MTGESQDELRQFIDGWLQQRRMELPDLARAADVSYVTLYKFMKGKRAGHSVLNRLAPVMDVLPERLHRLGGLLPPAVQVEPRQTSPPPPEGIEIIERRLARLTRAQREHYLRMFQAMIDAGEQGGEYDSAGDGN